MCEKFQRFKSSNETIDPTLKKDLVHELHMPCGQLEPKILKIDQFWIGKIDKLLFTLYVQTPCIKALKIFIR